MTDIDPREALEAAIHAANAQVQDGYSDGYRAALNELANLPRDGYLEVRADLIAALPKINAPIGAGLLAIWFGSEVESGIDPLQSAGAIVEALFRWTRTLETSEDETQGDATPEPHVAKGVQYLGQALVAHLARSDEARASAVARPGLIDELDRVEHLAVGAMWVLALLRQQSGTVVVLHGEVAAGTLIRYDNIANCFHLFTLLQAALANSMHGAAKADDEVVAVARGEAYGDVSDSAWWHYSRHTRDIGDSIWGEAAPDSIGRHSGQQFMVLWPPVLGGRNWDAGFFGPFLQASPPDVQIVRQLDREEVATWRQRLELTD